MNAPEPQKTTNSIIPGAEPIWIKRGPVGCLLFHGWTSSPNDFRELAQSLANKNISVSAPLLPGHGTKPEDLANVSYQDWEKAAEEAFANLASQATTIFVGGMSLGGNLALYLSTKHRVAGVISLATPIYFHFHPLYVAAISLLRYIKPYYNKRYPGSIDREALAKKIQYLRFPMKSAVEAARLMADTRSWLSQVTAPTLVMQTTSDHLVPASNATRLVDRLASTDKELYWVPPSYHVFTLGEHRATVNEKIISFINSHSS